MSTFADPTFCFAVTAEPDPSSLPRVLEVFALNGLVPARCHSHTMSEADGRLAIDLQVEGIDRLKADRLAQRLRAVVLVESVLMAEKSLALAS